jgi:hypothetical protein
MVPHQRGALAIGAVACGAAALAGCYLGVRAGPTVQRGAGLGFEGVGWQVSAQVGVQYDFFDKLRLAVVGGGGFTRQGTDRGLLDQKLGAAGVEADWTLRDWLWRRGRARCGVDVGGLGARWRAGAAYRGIEAGEEATTLTPDGGVAATYPDVGGHEVEVDTEIGVYAGKFNLYAGGGLQWRRATIDGLGEVDGFAPFVEGAVGFNLFIPRSLTVLMSHYGAVQARDEQAAWGRVDCSVLADSGDRSRCETVRAEQLQAWAAEERNQAHHGALIRARCADAPR